MSRSEYSDDCGGWRLICWRGAVASALRGKRGQAFLREILAALDEMPQKKLAANSFKVGAQYCTLGAVGAARGLDLGDLEDELGAARGLDLGDLEDEHRDYIAKRFGVAKALAAEVMYENDEGGLRDETPEQRWARMRAWAVAHIRQES